SLGRHAEQQHQGRVQRRHGLGDAPGGVLALGRDRDGDGRRRQDRSRLGPGLGPGFGQGGAHAGSNSLTLLASSTAWVRRRALILDMIAVMWVLTVASAMDSS